MGVWHTVNWDWTGSGLSIEQREFGEAIAASVIQEFRGDATVLMDMEGRVARPEALARFEAALVQAIRAYDAVRTHKINYLTTEYKRLINQTMPAVVTEIRETMKVVIVEFRSARSALSLHGVKSVELTLKQDDTGRGIFVYSMKDANGEEVASFPFDAIRGWWAGSLR